MPAIMMQGFHRSVVLCCTLCLTLHLRCVYSKQTVNTRCSSDVHRGHTKCVLDYTVMELWCDDTNFTSVPDPSTIEAYANPSKSRSLYINSSCLYAIDSDSQDTAGCWCANIASDFGACQAWFDDEQIFASQPMLLYNSDILFQYIRVELLNFDYNFISQIKDTSFAECTSLTELVLSNNKIRQIGEKAFWKLHKLKFLSLSNNELQAVNNKLFLGMHNVERLHLNGNKLTFVDENAFKDMERLTELDLSYNNLVSITWGRSTVFPRLRSLRLTENQLEIFDGADLRIFTKLVELDLRNNNLTCIASGRSFRMRQLSSLLISGNRLHVPQADWFRNVYHEKQLPESGVNLLNSNPWVCDCDAYSYWAFLKREVTQADWRNALDVNCNAPDAKSGKMLSSFGKESFKGCTNVELDHNCKKAADPPSNISLKVPLRVFRVLATTDKVSTSGPSDVSSESSNILLVVVVAAAAGVVVIAVSAAVVNCHKKGLKSKPDKRNKSDYYVSDTPNCPNNRNEESTCFRPEAFHPQVSSAHYETLSFATPPDDALDCLHDLNSRTRPKYVRSRTRTDSGFTDSQFSSNTPESVSELPDAFTSLNRTHETALPYPHLVHSFSEPRDMRVSPPQQLIMQHCCTNPHFWQLSPYHPAGLGLVAPGEGPHDPQFYSDQSSNWESQQQPPTQAQENYMSGVAR